MSDYPAGVTPATTKYCKAPGCISAASRAATANSSILSGARGLPVPSEAVPGTLLCPRHHGQFAMAVGELVHLWPQINDAVLRTPSREIRERVQTSKASSDGGALWNPAATDAVNQLRDWRAFLVKTILEDRPLPEKSRHLTWPTDGIGDRLVGPPALVVDHYTHGLTPATDTRLALAAIKLHHAYWLSSHPLLGARLLADALGHQARIDRAMHVDPSRRITINARCNEIVEETEYGPIYCDGQLYGLVRPGSDIRPTSILCGANPQHRIEKPAGGWLNV